MKRVFTDTSVGRARPSKHFYLPLTHWFVTVDLKDAFFHIQVVQRHRKFLHFAFGGKAYQYKVLPFGLALAPRTFTKCMDAALARLRLQGIRVLNYLDDWLILAPSRESVSYHRDVVLHHVRALRLRTNTKKSVLSPSQQTVFLGVHVDSVQMKARLAPARISWLLLWWIKLLGLHSTRSATRLIRVSHSCYRTLSIWRNPLFLSEWAQITVAKWL